MENPENFVFEGGGVKGLAYPGALLVLQDAQQLSRLKRIAGTSVGSIISLMLALNYKAEEIIKYALAVDFTKYESGWFLMNAWRLFEHNGYYSGHPIIALFENLIEQKLGDPKANLLDLHERVEQGEQFRDLYIVLTLLNRRRSEVASHNNHLYNSIPIAYLAYGSMTLPWGLEPLVLNGNAIVDGGVYKNFDLDLFDDTQFIPSEDTATFNVSTWGLRLDSTFSFEEYDEGKEVSEPIQGIFSFSEAVLDEVLNNQKARFRDPKNKQRCIAIDSGDIKTCEFSISREQRLKLMQNGARSAHEFLTKKGIECQPLEYYLQQLSGISEQLDQSLATEPLPGIYVPEGTEQDTAAVSARSSSWLWGFGLHSLRNLWSSSTPDTKAAHGKKNVAF